MIVKNRLAAVALSGAIIAGQLLASPVTGFAATQNETQTTSDNSVRKEHKGDRNKKLRSDKKPAKDVSGNCIRKGEKKEKPDKKPERAEKRLENKTDNGTVEKTEKTTE